MNLVDAIDLMKRYEKCPKCGCGTVGGGTGTLDIGPGYFIRSCSCGWRIEINEDYDAKSVAAGRKGRK